MICIKAIIQLRNPMSLSHANKRAICLPDNTAPLLTNQINTAPTLMNQMNTVPSSTNQMCWVAGWGHTSNEGVKSDTLLDAPVPIVPYEICNSREAYNGGIDKTMHICGGFREGT